MSTFRGGVYDLQSQKYIRIVQKLRACGLEEVLKLPKIAVIGNQSAAKSSLLEAISQTRLPRAVGTCTRCPMEVVLRRGDPDNWSCTVSLRFENSKHGTTEFGSTTSKDAVADLLRRAQLAILNPNTKVSDLYNLTETQCKEYSKELNFSKDIIVLEIIGADVDVTFVDLPGIIARTDKGQEDMVTLIRELAVSYISQPECLILVTISMRDDIDNQSALSLAQHYDPKGIRTIGVLTKPDTAEQGELEAWEKVMKNKSHPLLHGYYLTRFPNSDEKEMNMSLEKARKMEQDFFIGNNTWNKLDRNRLGSPKLAEALSHLLSQMIEELLPTLRDRVSASMRSLQEELQSLPRALEDNPQAELWTLCMAFTKSVEDFASGQTQTGKKSFLQHCQPLYHILREAITRTRPKVKVSSESDIQSIDGGVDPEEILLEEVREMIGKTKQRELAGITPFQVHEYYINKFVQKWESACLDIFRQVEIILKDQVACICEDIFGRFISSGLHYDVNVAVTELLEKAAEQTRKQIKDYCLTETNRPFTLNSNYLPSKERFRTGFAIARNRGSGWDGKPPQESFQLIDTNGSMRYFSTTDRTLFTVLAAYGVHISDITQLVRIHNDAYDPELDVGAHVMAYFDIASKRIVDDIPTMFETKFALNFAGDVSKSLHGRLRLVGEGGFEMCKRYVRDEPATQKKREDLTRHIGILQEAEETVIRFHTSN